MSEHCQNGNYDICLAGAHDGICCADSECDIDDEIRPAPLTASAVDNEKDEEKK